MVENKRRLGDSKIVKFTIESNSVVMSKIPKKIKDPKSFTLSLQIGERDIVQDLSNLGTSINFMPL